jgi:hypothetical protein
MKLRNKKTGEIGLVHCDATMFSNKIGVFIDNNHIDLRNPYKIYTSLAELNEEWEDYEEPKEYWYISDNGYILLRSANEGETWDNFRRQIGNYFSTKEEAEKAVEKLKAWKRLKECRFEFVGWKRDERYSGDYHIEAADYDRCDDEDLELLFGGGK